MSTATVPGAVAGPTLGVPAVDLSDYSMYIETTQAGTIGKLFEALNANVGSINLWFSPTNIASVSNDASSTCTTFLKLENRYFDTFHVDGRFMAGINIQMLFKLIKDSIKAPNTVVMYIRKDDQKFFFRVNKSTSYDSSDVPILTLPQPDARLPQVSYTTAVSMNSHALLQCCKTCGCTQTETIRISTDIQARTLSIQTVGRQNPAGKTVVMSESQDDLIFRSVGNDNFSGLFNLRLLHNIAKSSVMSEHVHILMEPQQPIVFQFDSGNLGHLKYFLCAREEDLL
jgi:proliferating cell nuclear antigen